MSDKDKVNDYPFRRGVVLTVFACVVCLMILRAYDLQILRKEFYRAKGDAISVRDVTVPSHRGMITDRNGEPLAISTPISSINAKPIAVLQSDTDLDKLARLLGTTSTALTARLKQRIGREDIYLKRQVTPELEKQIMDLNLPGVFSRREYRRYYPAAEVTAHIVGFTNVDDQGQEGLELAYNEWLLGTDGKKRVLKDSLGRVIENIESIQPVANGKDLQLSIDRRIQYLAYRELKAAVNLHKARSGSAVVLDAKTGEVVAMVNQPSYNPNNRSSLKSNHFRNRAVTDVFEPGSTMKPFTILAGLESGLYQASSMVDTTPGYFKVGNHVIRDMNNYGELDVPSIIKKSSNVGATKIALSLEPSYFWQTLSKVGFGQPTGSGYPGESSGRLDGFNNWSEVELATLSFGYGLSVTTLQLAQAYSVLAADGLLLPISFTKVSGSISARRVLSADVVQQVRTMMEAVVKPGGTGKRASVVGYRVAGKTGTVHISTRGGYAEDRYLSLFAGMAPASNPRLVMAVMINEPQQGQYYGGQVAAPVFSKVMDGAMRLLNLPPDDVPSRAVPLVADNQSNTEAVQ